MGKWVNNGMVSIPSSHSFGSDGDILEELGTLLGVGKRSDGKYCIADMCQASSINKWAKYKPVRYNITGGILEAQRKEVNYGLEFPYHLWFNMFGTDSSERILKYYPPRGNAVSPVEWNRIRDFDGYNHTASGLEIYLSMDAKVYAGQGFSGRLQVYNGSSQELTLSDFSQKYSTASSTKAKVLSDFYVMLLFKIGSSYAILNTGKTTAEMEGLPVEFTVSSSDFSFTEGTEVSVIACLAYDTNIPVGFNLVSQANGDYNTTYFIPLNTTTALEAEEHRTVVVFKLFEAISVINGTVTPPATGKNYYSFGNYFVISALNPWKAENTFRLYFLLKKDGNTIGSRYLEYTVTLELSEGVGRYLKDLGAITITPIPGAVAGTELWLDLQALNASNDFESVYSKKMYTH